MYTLCMKSQGIFSFGLFGQNMESEVNLSFFFDLLLKGMNSICFKRIAWESDAQQMHSRIK